MQLYRIDYKTRRQINQPEKPSLPYAQIIEANSLYDAIDLFKNKHKGDNLIITSIMLYDDYNNGNSD